jgi:amino acid adenylation domain-containing protein
VLAPELIERQADMNPEGVAVIDGERALTYRQLVWEASRLSGVLRAQGVRVGDRVVLSVERSAGAVVAILAILGVGATYVPAALDYPAERLRYIILDAKPKLWVVDHPRRAEAAPEQRRAVLSDMVFDAARSASVGGRVTLSPSLPAYMIYTSGSTGQPKGAVITHAGIPNLIVASKAFYGFAPGVKSLQLATLAFDTSLEETLGCLANGATLVIARDDAREPLALRSLVCKEQVSAMAITPSLLKTLQPEDFPTIRRIVAGGEEIDSSLTAQWSRRVLMNTYGPTEFTIVATYTQLKAEEVISIGKPLSNVHAYVLDSSFGLAPIGVPGELCLAGVQLALGYHGLSGLTAERFVPNPFTPELGTRMYRTGDRVRWLADGNLAFLGRIDHQVKIRGFRIELGDIESQLQAHALVHEAVVLMREDVPGDKRLVAYVTPKNSSSPPTSDTLRDHLKEKVPDYMIPAAVVVLDRLPLTPNGKTDRKALPPPNLLVAPGQYIAPRDALEERLCAIFAEVLHLPQVGIHDNFFALGGHSLAVTQVINRVRSGLGASVKVKELFQYPTVSLFATTIADRVQTCLGDLSVAPIAKVVGSLK